MAKGREKLVLVSICFIFMVQIFLMLPQFTLPISLSPNNLQGMSSRWYVPFVSSEESDYTYIHTASKRGR